MLYVEAGDVLGMEELMATKTVDRTSSGKFEKDVETLHDLITTEQCARLFKRTPLTVHIWRKDRGLPFVRIPGSGRDPIRFRIKRVVAWAVEKRVPGVMIDARYLKILLQESS